MSKIRLFLLLLTLTFTCCGDKEGMYVCKPCNLSCDELVFSEKGTCPYCGMTLIKKSDLALKVNDINIQEGSGVFLVSGGLGKENKNIKVYYHKPKGFTPDSKILLVIPGSGRNGDSYRDAWVSKSEKYGVFILSPMFNEEDYEFKDYHLGGIMYDLNLQNSFKIIEGTNVIELDETKFTYQVNPNPKEWIFEDLDRIFELTADAIDSNQREYDIFGHSAGGQISHRLTLFRPDSKANRILSANSGFYTVPSFETKLPFGIENAPINEKDLKRVFGKKLIVLVGELDNENETGGTMLRSTTVNEQGLHRLERAKYFYMESKNTAQKKGYDFNWTLKIIPDIGHNQRKMGDAAAKILYENNEK